jgi:hypothetical protein
MSTHSIHEYRAEVEKLFSSAERKKEMAIPLQLINRVIIIR